MAAASLASMRGSQIRANGRTDGTRSMTSLVRFATEERTRDFPLAGEFGMPRRKGMEASGRRGVVP